MEMNAGFNYFRQPENYFWQYAGKQAEVIEWVNERTICYTEDLLTVMRTLDDTGVPSLGVLLLILSACSDYWTNFTDAPGILYGLLPIMPQTADDPDDGAMEYYINQAAKALSQIAHLPADLRKGHHRRHLLQECVAPEHILLEKNTVVAVVDDWPQMAVHLAAPHLTTTTRSQFITDLKCLARIAEIYPDTLHLERKIRTGLEAIPLPAPAQLPEEKKSGDLLQDLLEEPRTEMLSRLARKIGAALYVPMHFQDSGGTSYGGVSDITNRGTFDKLLLSELAADNTLLLTRLAHNEALYLRREEPPHHPKTRRLLLLDTTLRLWGTPRIFAMSAALACTQHLRKGETVEACTLGGTAFALAHLNTTHGVLQILEQLDAALHCTTALAACLNETATTGQTDSIFITGEETLTEPAFQQWLMSSGEVLDFIITVNGSGDIQFHSVAAGRLKKLNSARISLEEVLAESNINARQSRKLLDELPAFLKAKPAPLLFPIESVYFHLAYSEVLGVAATITNNRLLYWYQNGKSPIELLSFINNGSFGHIGFSKNQRLYVLIDNGLEKSFKLITLDLVTYSIKYTDIELVRDKQLAVVYEEASESFLLRLTFSLKHTIAAINCNTAEIKEYSIHEKKTTAFDHKELPHNFLKRLTGRSYNIIRRIDKVFIDDANRFCLGEKHISVPSSHNNHISLLQGTGLAVKDARKVADRITLTENPNILFSRFEWADGSRLTADGRGFLHLQSSDSTLPEVTIVSIQGKSSTCWASDGAICGNSHFIPNETAAILQKTFYHKYITPFIQTILQNA